MARRLRLPKLREAEALLGGLTLALGLAAALGWHLGLVPLYRVSPDLPPLQYPAALALALLGGATLAHVTRHGRLVAALAAVVALQGGASLAAYAADSSALAGWIAALGTAPGTLATSRMSANASLCALLAGSALALLAWRPKADRVTLAVSLLGAVTAGVGAVALFGYASGIEPAMVWGGATEIAPQAALAFTAIGGWLIAAAWGAESRRTVARAAGLAAATGVGLLIATAGFWRAAENEWRAQGRYVADAYAALLRDEAQRRVLDCAAALDSCGPAVPCPVPASAGVTVVPRGAGSAVVCVEDRAALVDFARLLASQSAALHRAGLEWKLAPSTADTPLAEGSVRLAAGLAGAPWVVTVSPLAGSAPGRALPRGVLVGGSVVSLLAALLLAFAQASRLRREALAEAHAQLERKAESLARTNAELRRFSFLAAHDLKEPMRGAIIEVQRFLRGAGSRHAAEELAPLDEAVALAKLGIARLEVLLSYATSHDDLARQPTDLRAVVDAALRRLGPRLSAAGAAVEADPLPTLPVDARRLAVVFEEVLDNALTFRAEAPPRIHVGAAREADGAWRISVKDNGRGLAPEYHEKAFAMFTRISDPAARGGLGAGLATCRRIVEAHGGRMWLESAAGAGMTVHFTLPAA